MLAGSCLCGNVRYEAEAITGPLTFCHCSRCRKANGTAFLSAVPVDPAGFRVVAGRELLRHHESSPGVQRHFCSQCGSPMFSRRPGSPETIRLRVGNLDTPLPELPRMHIFYADRAEWFDLHDDAPRHAQWPE